jgi:hypothetical protein
LYGNCEYAGTNGTRSHCNGEYAGTNRTRLHCNDEYAGTNSTSYSDWQTAPHNSWRAVRAYGL